MEKEKIGVLKIIETILVCLGASCAVIGMYEAFLENYQLSTVVWATSALVIWTAYIIKDKHN